MRLFKSLAIGLLGLATSVAAQEDSVAVELERITFQKFIDDNSVVLTDCEFLCPRRRADVVLSS